MSSTKVIKNSAFKPLLTPFTIAQANTTSPLILSRKRTSSNGGQDLAMITKRINGLNIEDFKIFKIPPPVCDDVNTQLRIRLVPITPS